jgi:hypothetical protein
MKRVLGQRITAEERTYKLAQAWCDLDERITYYLATEDGKPADITTPCLDIHHYRLRPVYGLLIARTPKGGISTFEMAFCPKVRAVVSRLIAARVPTAWVEGLP